MGPWLAGYLAEAIAGKAYAQVIEERVFGQVAEIQQGSGGWLILKAPDGKIAGRVFPVAGADGKIEYLHSGAGRRRACRKITKPVRNTAHISE